MKVHHTTHASLYGTWDDVGGDQFLVQWHEGKGATVFNLQGFGYGGGVLAIYEIDDVDTLNKMLTGVEDKYQGDVKDEIIAWCKSQVKDSLV